MQKRLFHRPVFHQEHLYPSKKASWLELFYDLIYVASFIQLGNTFSDDISMGSFLKTLLIFYAFWVAWSGYTYYSSRYTVDDIIHRLTVFVHMFMVGSMTVTIREVFNGEYFTFGAIFGSSQILLGAMYLRSYIQQKNGRSYTLYWGSVFTLSGIIFYLSLFLPNHLMPYGWLVGLMGIIIATLTNKARSLMEVYPFDHEHLAERYGLLTIIVLGESFVKVLSELITHNSDTSLILQSSFTLLLTCSIWWIYFDDVADSELTDNNYAMPVWLIAHIPLQLSLIFIGIGIKKAILFDFAATLPFKYSLLLTVSLGVTLIATGVIDTVTKRVNQEISNNIRVNLRLFSGILFILIGLSSQSISNLTLLCLCLVIAVFQILIDIFFSPYQIEQDYLENESHKIANLVREKKERKKLNYVFNQPINKGLPNSYKKDLYYYFIEASWPVLFITLFCLYLVTNFLFAFLYILATAEMGEHAMSFHDAFFFSVQTMSTIGYGVLSPHGLYANVLVTVEAVVGLVGVATVTGIIFTKISRPRSKILFTDKMVLSKFDGKTCLSIRVGNARGNDIIEAKLNISMIKDEISEENEHIRRVYDLKLKRKMTPFFRLTWSIFHEIDEKSPLYQMEDLSLIKGFSVTMTGHDGSYSNTIYARKTYTPDDVYKDCYFKDIMHELPDGRMMIDYDQFHELKA